jgi:hypothetical protein
MGLSAGINAAQQAMERRRQRRDAGSLPRQQRGRTRTRNNNSRAQQVIQRPMSIRTNTAPVAVARTTQNPGSSQIQKAEEQFVILKNSTSFTKQNLVCNPLGGIVFPRLSQVASQYQKFEVLSLAYRYIPSCPTSTQGMVYMAFVPDALGELPTTVTEMKGLLGCISTAAWVGATLVVSREMMNQAAKQYYLRSGIGNDNLNNAGVFLLATDGGSNTSTIGNLSVNYTIALHQPRTLSGAATYSTAITGGSDTLSLAVTSPLVVKSRDLETYVLARQTIAPLFLVLKAGANNNLAEVFQDELELTPLVVGDPPNTAWSAFYQLPSSVSDLTINLLSVNLTGFCVSLHPKSNLLP